VRRTLLPLILFVVPAIAGQEPTPQAAAAQSSAAPIQTQFLVRYINGPNVYIDGGRNAGLAEGTKLVIKQNPSKPAEEGTNKAIEPGIIARLTVISVASTSAICELEASSRELVANDVVSLPDSEVEKQVEKNTLGNTRRYPLVVSFTEGDPLDEEVRDTIPRPPLPEINEMRGRIGFDMSSIHELGAGGATANEYGMVFRADFTRMFGTHWNLNGYWRGSFQSSAAPLQPTLQDTINRTYLMALTYSNPQSHWTAGIGRLYLPAASSLETIDGGYFGRQTSPNTVLQVFGGSTPDPSSWSYNPQGKIGGAYFNAHGGSYDSLHYSSSAGGGVSMLGWTINRPFAFTENNFSYKRYFSLFHSMQIDKPTANPNMPTVNVGLGQSILSMRVQVHPRVTLDVSDTYFRDVPTYDPALLGTGLLDKYLYQGVNGGARVELPEHITGYFSLGRSSTSTDAKSSLNELFGVSMSHIWKTGLQADVRYSKFDSAFASGTYRSVTLTRDLTDRLHLNLQGGQYAYNSPLAAASSSYFVNVMADTNLGARYFLQSAFTTQRGGTMNYDQWTTTLGYRFDNRASKRRAEHANQP
jgi:hypothetical protein